MEGSVGDKYRSHLVGEGERNTRWRHGSPPTYELVNLLFEQERTKEWPKGSLEETVQNAIKTWEMELSHKTRLQDFKSINPNSFRLSVNGAKPLTGEETLAVGSYNALLRSALPEELRCYKADAETFESSHELFRTAFPRGFAWEVTRVYAGPPTVVCKFRHWGYMEGPFKGHAPTGEMVQFHGVAVLKVDEELRVEEVEIYYDPGEFLAGLIKGPLLSSTGEVESHATSTVTATNPTQNTCPFTRSE
ncbi:pathogen-related protein [Ananas comosus]|uniref:Pathogen-related protein n=1 Tax=Ananas comosus TaxID=4615 RepID=A0A199VNX7_ANACO|nr:pathogen-related protein [Ananas comosus]OAY78754.1 Pathogen-related protein [Ananas comosus]